MDNWRKSYGKYGSRTSSASITLGPREASQALFNFDAKSVQSFTVYFPSLRYNIKHHFQFISPLVIVRKEYTHVRVSSPVDARADEGHELMTPLVDHEPADLALVALLPEPPETLEAGELSQSLLWSQN